MSLEDIKKKIVEDAQKQAQEITQTSKKEISNLEQLSKTKLTEIKKKSTAQAKFEAKNKARSILISANIEAKNQILKQKRSIIEKILNLSIEKLENLPDEKYLKIIDSEMQKLKALNIDNIVIIPSKNKKELINKSANQILGQEVQVDQETDKISGGFLVKSNQTIIDFSFENLINELKPQLEKKLSITLFKGINE